MVRHTEWLLVSSLLQQVVIEFYYAVAEGEALRLYRFAYFAHDV